MARKKRTQRGKKRQNLRAELLEDRRLLAGDSESEPNNAIGQANPMALENSSRVPGLIRNCISGEIQAGDLDFSSFTAFAGDQVSIAVSSNGSGLDPRLTLRNSAGSVLTQDRDSGPGQDSQSATFTIESSGTYYVEVAGDNDSTTGGYQLDAIVARGLGFESDQNQRNDTTNGAESVALSLDGGDLVAKLVGTVSADDGTNEDRDLYRLGALTSGVVVSVDLSTPEWSGLSGNVEVLNEAGDTVIDDNLDAPIFSGTILSSGDYFVRVSGTGNSGPSAQYAIEIGIDDDIAPRAESFSRLLHDVDTSSEIFATFSVQFSEALLASSVESASVTLVEAGADSSHGTADDENYALTFGYFESDNRIDFVVDDGPLGNGEYRLTLPSSITDRVGNALGGGGGYSRDFTVDAIPDGGVFEGSDNGDYTKATPLALEADTNGTGWLRSEVGYGSIDPAIYQNNGEFDWWSFQGQAGDKVDVWSQQLGALQPYAQLYRLNDAGDDVTSLVGDGSQSGGAGPDNDAYISGYELPVDGTYYVRMGKYWWDQTPGGYDIRINVARDVDLETDASYANDSTGGADALGFEQSGAIRSANIAGTLMQGENSNVDEDTFALGFMRADSLISLSLEQPQWSTFVPTLEVIDESGTVMADADSDPRSVSVTAPGDGNYFARISTRVAIIDGSRFTVTDQTDDWAEVRAQAQTSGGDLGTIESFDQNELIHDTLGGGLWIGLTDQDSEP